jgi:hypothetical protein
MIFFKSAILLYIALLTSLLPNFPTRFKFTSSTNFIISFLHSTKFSESEPSNTNRTGLKLTNRSFSLLDVAVVSIDNRQRFASFCDAFSTTLQPTMSRIDTVVVFCFVDIQLQFSSWGQCYKTFLSAI